MIKRLQKIDNSRGVILEKALLRLLKIEEDDRVEITAHDEGLLIKKVGVQIAYEKISEKHRKSLDKLGE